MEELNLNTREQLLVLLISTVAGFAASKFTENGLTKFFVRNKAKGLTKQLS